MKNYHDMEDQTAELKRSESLTQTWLLRPIR